MKNNLIPIIAVLLAIIAVFFSSFFLLSIPLDHTENHVYAMFGIVITSYGLFFASFINLLSN